MKKTVLVACIVIVAAAGAGLYFFRTPKSMDNPRADEATVRTLVTNFGRTLKNVSLQSPTAAQDIGQYYQEYLAPSLLEEWKSDPSKALGRLTSSPWPDRIEIGSVQQFGSGAYEVSGKIIEVTSQEEAQGKIVATRALQLTVIKFGNVWRIATVILAPQTAEDWKTSAADGVEFQYPEKLPTEFIATQEWPPTVGIAPKTFSCAETPSNVNSLDEIVTQRTIGERIYCVDVKNEGAAGSVYAAYVYTTPKLGQLVSIRFVLRYPNCGAYDAVQNQACVDERKTFDLDGMVDRIALSVRWDPVPGDNSLARQLSDCLPKSDWASHEKCMALMQQIQDFDACVMAGFSVMKSNPPQCRTVDGRTFVQGTERAWQYALQIIRNCGVEKVSQTHRRVVSLALKSGDTLVVTEPQIDDIIVVTEAAQSKCGKIPVATE
ncbi:MAG: hypothetical protein PHI63_00440 [Patescibacteria group bacterium]|nr:hypothetical protein [Patescibacteria group bacterium]